MTNTPAKIDKFELLLELLSENRGRVIIWCAYINTAEMLAARLAEYTVFVHHGKKTPAQNEQAIKSFGETENSILIATLDSAGKGYNLQFCNTEVFYECSLIPSVNEQAMDRAHRIGQTRAVTVYFLYGRNTIEEAIIKMLRGKQSLIDLVVENKSTQYTMKKLVRDLKLN